MCELFLVSLYWMIFGYISFIDWFHIFIVWSHRYKSALFLCLDSDSPYNQTLRFKVTKSIQSRNTSKWQNQLKKSEKEGLSRSQLSQMTRKMVNPKVERKRSWMRRMILLRVWNFAIKNNYVIVTYLKVSHIFSALDWTEPYVWRLDQPMDSWDPILFEK